MGAKSPLKEIADNLFLVCDTNEEFHEAMEALVGIVWNQETMNEIYWEVINGN